ncbi:restriction endonuclease [Haloarcula sp. H-GB4]|uniref:restriction endonuclease n=1 Tax=Haloarcula sp. H-GB4 TaxID=3069755 RepID=UPI0027AFCC1B|nr:restriction endonuclease [Haloarcula sp. H-GB4]MDQ2074714.1 restriction endonuclease [Haloarcula sp. H-GB4]
MTDQHTLKDQLQTSDSLAEFLETTDASVNAQAQALIEGRWDREVPHDRAVAIVREELERVTAYDSISRNSSARSPRYMDLTDLELVSGYEFEHILAEILSRVDGEAQVTEASGDQGVDVVWFRESETVGIQAKAYDKQNPVGNSAVQEIYTGATVRNPEYEFDTAAVVTTSQYTNSAREAADNSDVTLYGRKQLQKWLDDAELDADGMGKILAEIR